MMDSAALHRFTTLKEMKKERYTNGKLPDKNFLARRSKFQMVQKAKGNKSMNHMGSRDWES